MYVTEANDQVRYLFEELSSKDNIVKMRFLLYVMNQLANDQINSTNEANPNTREDPELEIFNIDSIGYSGDYIRLFLEYNVMCDYRIFDNYKTYVNENTVIGIENSEEDEKIQSNFETLDFLDKLDVVSELLIRYESENYFDEEVNIVLINPFSNGYDIASRIQKYKSWIKES